MSKFIRRYYNKKTLLVLVALILVASAFNFQTELFAKDNEYQNKYVTSEEMDSGLEELKSKSLDERIDRTQDFSVHFLEDAYYGINKDNYLASGQAYFVTENINNYPVFCINPEIQFTTLNDVSSLKETNEDTFSNLDSEIQANIISIMNFSIERYAETNSNIYLAVGQLLIWEELGYEISEVSPNIKPEMVEVKNSYPKSEIVERKAKFNLFSNKLVYNFKASTIDEQVYGIEPSSNDDRSSLASEVDSEESTTVNEALTATTDQSLYNTSGQDLVGQGSGSSSGSAGNSNGSNGDDDNGSSDTNPISYNEKPVIVVDESLTVVPGVTVDKQLLVDQANLSITDKEDGDLIDSENTSIDVSKVDTDTPGTYEVDIKTSDSNNNEATGETKIIVSNPPTISIDDEIVVSLNTTIDKDYLVANASLSATDIEDGDLTSSDKTVIDIEQYKKDTEGEYDASVTTTDSDGLTATEDFVIKVSNSMPQITVDNRVIVTINTTVDTQYLIDNANLAASDEEDGDLTSEIEANFTDVDTSVLGDHTVNLSVVDSDGNEATRNTIIEVIAEAPILTIADSITIFVGEYQQIDNAFLVDELNMSASDKNDGDLTDQVEIVSNPFEDAVGTYTIDVRVENSAGIEATASTKVIVIENTPPVVTMDNAITVDLNQNIDIKYLSENANLVVYDAEDGDLIASPQTTIDLTNYDKTSFGDYQISVSTEDSMGETAMDSITVSIVNENPILELEPSITVPYDTVVDAQYLINNDYVLVASDKEDGDISETLTLDCLTLDTTQPGDYSCSGTIEDSAGATATDDINITVLPYNNPPVINIQNTTVEIGTIVDQDYYIANNLVEATDIEDGTLTNTDQLVIDFASYDKDNEGEYLITASATDSLGATTIETAIVKVIDTALAETPKIIVDPVTTTDILNKGLIDKQFLIDNAGLRFIGSDGEAYLSSEAVVSVEKNCLLTCNYDGDVYLTINVDSSTGYSADEARAEIIFDSPPTISVADIELIESATRFELTPYNLVNYMPEGTVTYSDDKDNNTELLLNSTINLKTKSNYVGDVPGSYTYIYTLADSFGHQVEDEFTVTVLDVPEIYGNSELTIEYSEQADFNTYYNMLTSEDMYNATPANYKLGLYVKDSDEDDMYWEDVSNISVGTSTYSVDSTTNDPGTYTFTYSVIDSGTASNAGTQLNSSEFELELTVLPVAEKSIDVINIQNTTNLSKYNVEYSTAGYTYENSTLQLNDDEGYEILSDEAGGVLKQDSDTTYDSKYTAINTCEQLSSFITSNPDGDYILTSDLDCYGEDLSELQQNTTFTGELYGNDHVINGLTVTITQEETCVKNTECVIAGGLFSRVKNGVITNLGLNDIDMIIELEPDVSYGAMSGDAVKVGGMIGETEGATIDEVYVQGTLEVTGAENDSKYVISPLSGFGGLIGADYTTGSSVVAPLSITNTYTNVDISGSTVNTGGIIGSIKRVHSGNGLVFIDNVLASGDIESHFVAENVVSTIGGLLGYVSATDGVTLQNVLYTGNLIGYKSTAGNTAYNYGSHTVAYSAGTTISGSNVYYSDTNIVIAGEIVTDANNANSVSLTNVQLQDSNTYNFLNTKWYIPNGVSANNQPLLSSLLITYEYSGDLEESDYDLYSPDLEVYINLNQQADLPLANTMKLVVTLYINDGTNSTSINSVDDSNGITSYEAINSSVQNYMFELFN